MHGNLPKRFILALAGLLALVPAAAEDYMQRGASVGDYEQALDRALEKQRGLRIGTPPPAKPAPAPAQAASTSRPAAPAGSSAKPAAVSAHKPAAPRTAPDVYTPPTAAAADTAGLSIYFGYDSAQLTRDAREALDTLGQALRAPKYAGMRWIIEGHTDAAGAEIYNQQLSEERARAAQRYLIETRGVASELLSAVGRGETEPYDPAHPQASINRRVRIRPDAANP